MRIESTGGSASAPSAESPATGADHHGPSRRQPADHPLVSRAEAHGPRFVSLLLATVVIALALSAVAGAHALYQGKERHRQARTPVLQTQGQKQGNATRWLVGSDSLQGERRFSVVYLSPHSGDAPLPPGIHHWPAPGEAVLSPALLKAGAAEHIERRYGRPAATIGREGLEDPGEWLAYVRPAAGLSARQPTAVVTGFGPSAGTTAQGLEPGSGRSDDQPEWMFLVAVTGLLLLPGLALLLVAVRLGMPGRPGGTGTNTSRPGDHSAHPRPALGGTWQPVLLGAVIAALPVTAALRGDVRVPFTDYLLSSADLRSYGWLLAGGPVAAAVVVIAAAVSATRLPARRTAAWRLRTWSGEHVTQLAWLCPLSIVLAMRGPDLGSDPRFRMGVIWLGILGTALTVPAVAAVASGTLGRRLVRRGQRRGRAETVAAGRLATMYPGTPARLVTGVTVALVIFLQAVAWQGLFGWQNTESRATFDRIGRSVVEVVPNGAVTTRQMASFLRRIPESRAVLLSPPSGAPEGPLALRSDCPALENLRLPCPEEPVRLDRLPADTRLQELIKWNLGSSSSVEVSRIGSGELAKQAAGDTTSTLVLLHPTGRDLAVPDLKALGYRVFPRGAGVKALGEDNITADVPHRDQGRWVVLFGIAGIGVMSVAAGCAATDTFLRRSRALAARSTAADRGRILWSTALWSVLVPLAAAGVVGPLLAAWLTAPVSNGGPTYVSTGLLVTCGAVVLVVALLAWLCAALIASRRTPSGARTPAEQAAAE